MFAWYVKTGKRYSFQTQENRGTKLGAALVALVQPTHTVRSMKYRQIEAEITKQFTQNLNESRQAACQEFWKQRDEGRT